MFIWFYRRAQVLIKPDIRCLYQSSSRRWRNVPFWAMKIYGAPCRGRKSVRICSAECPSPPKCRPSMQLRKQRKFKEWVKCHVQPKQISDLTHSKSIRTVQNIGTSTKKTKVFDWKGHASSVWIQAMELSCPVYPQVQQWDSTSRSRLKHWTNIQSKNYLPAML